MLFFCVGKYESTGTYAWIAMAACCHRCLLARAAFLTSGRMTYFSALLSLLFAALADTAWVALFRAKPVGKFQVIRQGEALFQFTSTTGTFSVFPKERRLEMKDGNRKRSVNFSDLKGLEYRANQSYALLQEFFFGFDLTDSLARYQDTVDWFSIAVVTYDNQRIPLFLSGQYTQREFLISW